MKRMTSLAVAILVAGCGGTGSSDTTLAQAATTTTVAATTTTTTSAGSTTTATPSGAALVTANDGTFTIDWDALRGAVFFSPAGGGADPLFFVHTSPDVDGFFFSVEAYTVYGTGWTGQLGDFIVDCRPGGTGICVHFDPDGPGPIGDLGADFLATGDVTIIQADADGFVAEFSNVVFTDGTTIPGPFTVTG